MPDTRDYQVINDLARNTPWAHAPAVAYADYGMLLLAAVALGATASHVLCWTARVKRGHGRPRDCWCSGRRRGVIPRALCGGSLLNRGTDDRASPERAQPFVAAGPTACRGAFCFWYSRQVNHMTNRSKTVSAMSPTEGARAMR
jgi:hypothetical protein